MLRRFLTAKDLLRSLHISLGKRIRGINFAVPEKFRGTVVERAVTFWKNVYLDYESTVTDVVNGAKAKPKKAVFFMIGCGLLAYCAKLNPDERSFREEFLTYVEDLTVLPAPIRNPLPLKEFNFIEKCYNEGKIHWLSLGILSVIWFSDYDDDSGLYEARCSYLQPRIVSFPSRIIDVGFLGKWWRISLLMKDFDVNQEELTNEYPLTP